MNQIIDKDFSKEFPPWSIAPTIKGIRTKIRIKLIYDRFLREILVISFKSKLDIIKNYPLVQNLSCY